MAQVSHVACHLKGILEHILRKQSQKWDNWLVFQLENYEPELQGYIEY